MKYFYDIHGSQWFWTFAIGLPVCVVATWFIWRRAQTSVPWRFLLCLILACVVTPLWTVDAPNIDIYPAVLLLWGFGHANEQGAIFIGIEGIFYISLTSLLPLFIWSVILRVKKMATPDPTPAQITQIHS